MIIVMHQNFKFAYVVYFNDEILLKTFEIF